MMQITLAMRSVALSESDPSSPAYMAYDRDRGRSVNVCPQCGAPAKTMISIQKGRPRRGQLCTSRNGIVGLPPPPQRERGRVTYFNCGQARDARWAQLARPHDIPASLPNMKGFRRRLPPPSRYLRLRYSSKSAHFFGSPDADRESLKGSSQVVRICNVVEKLHFQACRR